MIKIKLLFIMINIQGGGAERVLLNLLRHLDTQKYEITLLLLKKEGKYWNEIPDHVRVVSVLQPHQHLRFYVPSLFTKGLQEAQKHDVIVGGLELTPTYLAYILGILSRKPVVGWVHTDIRYLINLVPKWHSILGKYIYKRIPFMVFVSYGACSAMAKWLACDPRSEWLTIYNIFDPDIYSQTKLDSTILLDLDLPLVVSAGRLDHTQKDFDLLIKAHAYVVNRGYKHRLIILGEGKDRRKLEMLVKTLGVQDSVIMPGFVNNPIQYMEKATMFVLSSRFEGFGMVLLEAMLAGTPVISTDCEVGPREILGNNEFGLLVPVGDADALANAIIQLFCDENLRLHYRKKGLERYKKFLPNKIVPLWDQFFYKILEIK